jgi:hypothetical protein
VNDEQPRRKVRVDLEELRFAMEDASYEHRYFLDTEAGDVILASEMFDDEETQPQLTEIDEAEPGRYLQVLRTDSREGYDDMQDFIDTVSDERPPTARGLLQLGTIEPIEQADFLRMARPKLLQPWRKNIELSMSGCQVVQVLDRPDGCIIVGLPFGGDECLDMLP